MPLPTLLIGSQCTACCKDCRHTGGSGPHLETICYCPVHSLCVFAAPVDPVHCLLVDTDVGYLGMQVPSNLILTVVRPSLYLVCCFIVFSTWPNPHTAAALDGMLGRCVWQHWRSTELLGALCSARECIQASAVRLQCLIKFTVLSRLR